MQCARRSYRQWMRAGAKRQQDGQWQRLALPVSCVLYMCCTERVRAWLVVEPPLRQTQRSKKWAPTAKWLT